MRCNSSSENRSVFRRSLMLSVRFGCAILSTSDEEHVNRILSLHAFGYGICARVPTQTAGHGGVDLVRRVGAFLSDDPHRLALLVHPVQVFTASVAEVPLHARITVV